MKDFAKIMLFLFLASAAYGQNAHDVEIKKRNAANTKYEDITLPDPGADRVLGWVDATNTLEWVAGGGGGTGAFASIMVEGNATETVIAASSTDFTNKVQVLIFDTNGDSNGITPDHTSDHITIDTDGDYIIAAHFSASNGSNDTISAAIFKNNGATQIGARSTRKLGTGGDVGAQAIVATASLTAGDTIELWFQNESSTGNITVQDACIEVFSTGSGGTGLTNWSESGTTLQPNADGYNLGSATNLIGASFFDDTMTIRETDDGGDALVFTAGAQSGNVTIYRLNNPEINFRGDNVSYVDNTYALVIGDTAKPGSSDARFTIGGSIDDTVGGASSYLSGTGVNSHGLSIEYDISRTGNIGHNDIDIQPSTSGIQGFDHISHIQFRADLNSTGAIGRVSEIQSLQDYGSAAVTFARLVEKRNPTATGIVNNEFMYFENPAGGSTSNTIVASGGSYANDTGVDADQTLWTIKTTDAPASRPKWEWDDSQNAFSFNNSGVQLTEDIILAERADHASTPADGFGYLWVKTGTPSTLIFTDDAGTDVTLGAAGAGDNLGNHTATQNLDMATFNVVIDDERGFVDDVNGDELLLFDVSGGASADYFRIGNGTGNVNFQARGDSANIDINLTTKGTGQFNMTGDIDMMTNNIIFGTSDADWDLLEVNVTGAPKVSWDESEDEFDLNKGLNITGNLDITGDLSMTNLDVNRIDYNEQASITNPAATKGSIYLDSDDNTFKAIIADEGNTLQTILTDQSQGVQFQSYQVSDLSDTTTPSVLVTAETDNKLISNYKSTGADHVFTMPAAHAGGNVTFVIGDEFQVDIEPNSGDLFYLNGTAMAVDEHIQNTADTLGDTIVGVCVNINGTYRWMFRASDSNWVEATP